ncbi:hypothetical protein MBLNU230_g4574t1 [Neophaeotheca triangularis]
MSVTPQVQTQMRSLYRQFLRELPNRQPSMLANPSPIQQSIRADLTTSASSSAQGSKSVQHQVEKPVQSRLQEAEQFVQYVKAQRLYATLLERYNPGMNMNEEERVRLTARRVGMDLPEEWENGKKQ